MEIAVAGDVHFEGALAPRLLRPASALTPAATALAAADVAIVNLETSVGSGGRPEPGKRFVFSAGTAAFEALAAAGIDVASMANNHALDFGRARLPSTLRTAAAARPELAVVGIGADQGEAFAPAVTDVRRHARGDHRRLRRRPGPHGRPHRRLGGRSGHARCRGRQRSEAPAP